MNRYVSIKCFLIVLVFAFAPIHCSKQNSNVEPFTKKNIEIARYGIFDLGVTDIDSDDQLDIYTANHSALQSFLLNDGNGRFSDAYSTLKMDQDLKFKGLAISPNEPNSDRPGVYINWVGPDIVVRYKSIPGLKVLDGRIEVLTSISLLNKSTFDIKVDVHDLKISPQVVKSTIHFSSSQDGYFRFRPFNHAIPFRFFFNQVKEPKDIFVGNLMVSPKDTDFIFQLRDRHGLAWMDFNKDDKLDVYITRGGENDTMKMMPMDFFDELLIANPIGFKDIGETLSLSKDGCPGRQVACTDFNNDNLADIYVVCGRGLNVHDNMLFQQTNNGTFAEVAEKTGLNIQTNGFFAWIDIDSDNDLDLFWTDIDGHFIYRNTDGTFHPIPLETFNRNSLARKISIVDFDNDGDLDIFSASFKGNLLFINNDGELATVLPESKGLPKKSMTASWVDVDNDGFIDLHSVPQGIYFQNDRGTFSKTDELNIPHRKFSRFKVTNARSQWFDMDNNGTRDLILATEWKKNTGFFANWMIKLAGVEKQFGGLGYFWNVDLYENNSKTNAWLQVQLIGPPGNREAVGGRVTLQAKGGYINTQQIGSSEGSHYSDGHHRLYFGLGQMKDPLSLTVYWPDGRLTKLEKITANQLIKIYWKDS
jgi:hypothetical protein